MAKDAPRKKLKPEDRLALKTKAGIIPESSKDSNLSLRDVDLRQNHKKRELLTLAHEFFALGGRSLAQVALDKQKEYILASSIRYSFLLSC
jgi:hypothetical protein